MKPSFLNIEHISFTYPGVSFTLFEDITLQLPSGWTGLVGANGCGKTTLLKLCTGILTADSGTVHSPGPAVYCPQRTDNPPEYCSLFLEQATRSAAKLRTQLAIEGDWLKRWSTLSHGERKRLQLAVALWQDPLLLAVDEPTNHLDCFARDRIVTALQDFKGIGILVSHDRFLLNQLCCQCAFLEPPNVVIRSGGFTESFRTYQHEKDSANRNYLNKKQEIRKLQHEFDRRKRKSASADRKRSKKGVSRKDHDAKEKLDRARVTGKDATAGKLQNQLKGRLKQARKNLETLSFTKKYATGIWFPEGFSKRDTLLRIKQGYLHLAESKSLFYPDISLLPRDRIGIRGINGSGKSSLIRYLHGQLQLPPERITMVPQEIDLQTSRTLQERVQNMPPSQLGFLMTVIKRLGSEPKRLLESDIPSPGETRKLLLGLGLVNEPHILIMDEPTNHMDLVSIEALEAALSGCPCCLILVSHDTYFLDNLVSTCWTISARKDQAGIFELRISAS
jgi:ATPase subunit of ABC transporter with duplicated ATPase domains